MTPKTADRRRRRSCSSRSWLPERLTRTQPRCSRTHPGPGGRAPPPTLLLIPGKLFGDMDSVRAGARGAQAKSNLPVGRLPAALAPRRRRRSHAQLQPPESTHGDGSPSAAAQLAPGGGDGHRAVQRAGCSPCRSPAWLTSWIRGGKGCHTDSRQRLCDRHRSRAPAWHFSSSGFRQVAGRCTW